MKTIKVASKKLGIKLTAIVSNDFSEVSNAKANKCDQTYWEESYQLLYFPSDLTNYNCDYELQLHADSQSDLEHGRISSIQLLEWETIGDSGDQQISDCLELGYKDSDLKFTIK